MGSLPEAVSGLNGQSTARVTRAVDFAIRTVAAVSIALLTAVVLIGVGSRALGDPYAWTDELSRLLMVWVSMFGWMLASRSHAHIRIRFFHLKDFREFRDALVPLPSLEIHLGHALQTFHAGPGGTGQLKMLDRLVGLFILVIDLRKIVMRLKTVRTSRRSFF